MLSLLSDYLFFKKTKKISQKTETQEGSVRQPITKSIYRKSIAWHSSPEKANRNFNEIFKSPEEKINYEIPRNNQIKRYINLVFKKSILVKY